MTLLGGCKQRHGRQVPDIVLVDRRMCMLLHPMQVNTVEGAATARVRNLFITSGELSQSAANIANGQSTARCTF
jgi:hypothetical protein